jgi:hypothetical protein
MARTIDWAKAARQLAQMREQEMYEAEHAPDREDDRTDEQRKRDQHDTQQPNSN